MRSIPLRRRAAPLALAAALALVFATEGRAAEPRRWQVAPAGPCAEALPLAPCPGGKCSARSPARSRFDATDVAAAATGGGNAPPTLESFPGPGSCADPSTPCGPTEPTRVAENPPPPPALPPPAAASPATPPAVVPPPPPALPPAPPAPVPPGVVEPPVGPGTLPGLP